MSPVPEKQNSHKAKIVNDILHEISHSRFSQIDISGLPIFKEFLGNAINGDNPIDYLIVPGVGEINNKAGFFIYILTTSKVIKIFSDGNGIEANNYPLSTFTGMNQQLIEDGKRFQFIAQFQTGGIGLKFPPDNKKALAFFQNIEEAKKNNG